MKPSSTMQTVSGAPSGPRWGWWWPLSIGKAFLLEASLGPHLKPWQDRGEYIRFKRCAHIGQNQRLDTAKKTKARPLPWPRVAQEQQDVTGLGAQGSPLCWPQGFHFHRLSTDSFLFSETGILIPKQYSKTLRHGCRILKCF